MTDQPNNPSEEPREPAKRASGTLPVEIEGASPIEAQEETAHTPGASSGGANNGSTPQTEPAPHAAEPPAPEVAGDLPAQPSEASRPEASEPEVSQPGAPSHPAEVGDAREPPVAAEEEPVEPEEAAAAGPGEELPADPQASSEPSAEAEEVIAPAEETPETAATGPSAEATPAEAAPAEAAPAAAAKPKKAEKPEKKTARRTRKKATEEAEPKPDEPKSEDMDWYILKVQSNREDSIREGLMRRVAIAGLGYYFGDVIVPTEKVTEFKGGKKRVTKRKLYPGYLVVQMEITEETWFLVRETPGIGDFTGAAGRPTPMLPHEVSRILAKKEEKSDEAPKLKIAFQLGDRVKITEGTFENFEGEVSGIDETNGRVTVMINIFGRSTPVELEYWQIEGL